MAFCNSRFRRWSVGSKPYAGVMGDAEDFAKEELEGRRERGGVDGEQDSWSEQLEREEL